MLSLVGSSNVGTGAAYGTFASGNYVYVADGQGGLEIVDVSDPTNPVVIGSFNSYTNPTNISYFPTYATPFADTVVVAGNYAYVGDQQGGLDIFDVSAPSSPMLVGSYPVDNQPYASSVAVSGNYAYINGLNYHDVITVDVSNPSAPALVTSIMIPSSNFGISYPSGVAVAGNYLYVADYLPAIEIVNISDPTHPSIVGRYATSPFHPGPGATYGPNALAVSGNYLYVADLGTGFYILDISNPASPVLVGSYDPGDIGSLSSFANQYSGVQVEGNFAFVTDISGNLIELDVSNPTAPTLVESLHIGGVPRGLSVVGNYAYVADDYNGLKIINLGSPVSIVPPPTVSIIAHDANKAEGNSGTTPFTFEVVRSGDTTGTTMVGWSVAGGQLAAANGLDFVGGNFPSGTIVFNPGDSIKTVTVNIQGDTTFESNENFVVNLGNATSGAIIDSLHASANGQIINDDAAPPPLPDLTVETFGIIGGTTSLHPGDLMYVASTGGSVSGSSGFIALRDYINVSGFVDLGLYLSADSAITTNDTLLAEYNVYSQGHVVGARFPYDLTSGQYYIGVIVDPFNRIAESNEQNNASTGFEITITAPNHPPVASNIAADANEDSANPVTLTASYTDADLSDSHSFSINATATVGKVTNNGDGTFAYDPNGKFEYLAVGETATDTFTYTVDDGHGGTSTASAIVTIHGENDAPKINNKVFNVDHLTDGQIAVEMVKLAIDAYPDNSGSGYHTFRPLASQSGIVPDSKAQNDAQADNWHALSARELGINSSGQQGTIQYSLVNGYYQAISNDPQEILSSDPSEADALVLTGVVNGKMTLTVSFAGTDQLSDWLDFPSFAAHYAKFAPLAAAVKNYIDANHVEQVFVSGHSLGAAMAQYFMEDSVFSDESAIFQGWTIGSPGADKTSTTSSTNVQITNFIHASDVVTMLPLLPLLPLVDKEALIPEVADLLIIEGHLAGASGLVEAYQLASGLINGTDKARAGTDVYLGATFGNPATAHDAFLYRNDVSAYYGRPLLGLSAVPTSISELANVTGATGIDSISAKVSFSDPDASDRPTASIDGVHQSVTYQDVSGNSYSLTPVQLATFDASFQTIAEAGNTNAGKVDWTYSIADKALDFVGADESITVTTPIVIDDHHGGVIAQDIVVTIFGSNDNPVATPDSSGVAKGTGLSVPANIGVLMNDTDPDLHDHGHLNVSAVNGLASNVGIAIRGSLGSLNLRSDGSYSYVADAGRTPSNGATQDVFSYAVSDGHGGKGSSTLSIVVFDPSAKYQAGINTILSSGNGKGVLDGSAGNDVIVGGNGPDFLIGGPGDLLSGGNGSDTFLFRPNFGGNKILDFDVKNEVIQFDKSIFSNVGDILNHTTNTAAGAMITDANGDTVTLVGVTVSQLQAHQSDFHLV